ncbi:MAG: aminotransferase class V-fold PLP-dependent enzyme [Bacteroidota bacterium]|jgi:selenocysteine lyase/cysteine desulfurase|nr:aminotransferase class V-fold PLP-dependent enzyme [Bacteroidota bacterium]
MNTTVPRRCHWKFEDLRPDILGIDTMVPLLDGTRVPYVFLDNGASTPSFRHALDVMAEFMPFYSGVHRGTGFKSILATQVFDEAHDIAGHFVGADLAHDTVIFVKNTTEAVNKLANRCDWRPGDVVITTMMEHHSDDLPWRRHATVVHVGVDDLGYLDMDELRAVFAAHRGHVRFLAATGASNITGIINPIHDMAELAHANGAAMFVDAAQLAPHRAIDIRPVGDPGHIDFIAYSAHKMYAPYGIGVLIGPKTYFANGDPDMVGGGVVDVVELDFVAWSAPPAREEAGSPNVPGAVALAAAIHMLTAVGMDQIAAHEHDLVRYAIRAMRDIPHLRIHGPVDDAALAGKVGVISFDIDGVPHAKTAAILSAEGGIGVRNGCFCAHPYVKRLLRLDDDDAKTLTDEILAGDRTNLPGMVRASFGCYNTVEDVDRLVAMLHRIVRGDYHGDYELNIRSGSYWPRNFDYDFSRYFPHFAFRPSIERTDIAEAS